jgi:GNAT superfamily N-acetyltransferase
MLVPFHRLTADQLTGVIAIYEEALAAPWEWPVERFREIARGPGSRFWAMAALEGDEPAGFIIDEYLPAGRLWYIHYFAVRTDLRAQGWGSRILTASLPIGEDAAAQHGHDGCTGTLLEAVAVGGQPPGATRGMAVRRQEFYRRHGAIVTGAQYPRPPDAPPDMPDYDLLFVPGRAWDGRLDNAFRRRLVRSLTVEGYGVPEAAAWLQAALARYAD